MMKRRALRPKRGEAPKNAVEGVPWVRRYLVDLYDREDGAAADWQMIAETAFKVGLDAIDKANASQRWLDMLHRLHEAAYDRMTQNGADGPMPQVVIEQQSSLASTPTAPAKTLTFDSHT